MIKNTARQTSSKLEAWNTSLTCWVMMSVLVLCTPSMWICCTLTYISQSILSLYTTKIQTKI